MKYFFTLLSAVSLAMAELFAQGHIAPCGGPGDHSTPGICYGYATGRAAGRYPGDAVCDPLTFYRTSISQSFFLHITNDPNLNGLQVADIIEFYGHVAYVGSVGSPVGQSRVDQYSPAYGHEQNKLLSEVVGQFGSWLGYYRRKQVNVTVQNSFPGGVVKINEATVSAGTHPLNWWGAAQTLEAVNRQNILDQSNNTYYIRVYQFWSTPEEGNKLPISISIIPKPSQVYTANFKKEFNITFQNNFPGVGNGGVIKVNGVQYNYPFPSFPVLQDGSITGEAIDQTISGASYIFTPGQPAQPLAVRPSILPTTPPTRPIL